MKISEVIELIEKEAPLCLAYQWDNSGFLCGDINKDIQSVYLTLDINKKTVDEAVKAGADMIISHHPIMFGGIKRINYNDPDGYVIKRLIENDIAVYAAHTSMDCAKHGINELLAQKLDLKNIEVIEKNEKYPDCGLGRIAKTDMISVKELAKKVKEKLDTPFVRVSGDTEKAVTVVAVGSGACDDLIPNAIELGADVLITADMKYHIAMDAAERGLAVIDAGHYPTEFFVVDIFKKIIDGCNLKITKSCETDTFKLI